MEEFFYTSLAVVRTSARGHIRGMKRMFLDKLECKHSERQYFSYKVEVSKSVIRENVTVKEASSLGHFLWGKHLANLKHSLFLPLNWCFKRLIIPKNNLLTLANINFKSNSNLHVFTCKNLPHGEILTLF